MKKPRSALNKKATKFITEKLIPFMQREHGNGFAMGTWISRTRGKWSDLAGLQPGDTCEFDSIERPLPPCETVACIGGSIQHLTGRKRNLHKHLGITHKQADGLFRNWVNEGYEYEFGWPEKFITRFDAADTPRKKAAVAVALLKQIILKGGDILKNPNYNEPY